MASKFICSNISLDKSKSVNLSFFINDIIMSKYNSSIFFFMNSSSFISSSISLNIFISFFI